MTTIKAEVPMSEVLTYSQTLDLAHRRPRRLLDALPPLRGGAAHVAQKVIEETAGARGGGDALLSCCKEGGHKPAFRQTLKEPGRDLALASRHPPTSPEAGSVARCASFSRRR